MRNAVIGDACNLNRRNDEEVEIIVLQIDYKFSEVLVVIVDRLALEGDLATTLSMQLLVGLPHSVGKMPHEG
jgi:hypothetical protein